MQKRVCHHQEDIEACKLVHMVGDANSNPNELLVSLALHYLLPVTCFLAVLVS